MNKLEIKNGYKKKKNNITANIILKSFVKKATTDLKEIVPGAIFYRDGYKIEILSKPYIYIYESLDYKTIAFNTKKTSLYGFVFEDKEFASDNNFINGGYGLGLLFKNKKDSEEYENFLKNKNTKDLKIQSIQVEESKLSLYV